MHVYNFKITSLNYICARPDGKFVASSFQIVTHAIYSTTVCWRRCITKIKYRVYIEAENFLHQWSYIHVYIHVCMTTDVGNSLLNIPKVSPCAITQSATIIWRHLYMYIDDEIISLRFEEHQSMLDSLLQYD